MSAPFILGNFGNLLRSAPSTAAGFDLSQLPSVVARESLPEDQPYVVAALDSYRRRRLTSLEHDAVSRWIDESQQAFRSVFTPPCRRRFMFTIMSDPGVSAVPVGFSILDRSKRKRQLERATVHAFLKDSTSIRKFVPLIIQGSKHRIFNTGGYQSAAELVPRVWEAMLDRYEPANSLIRGTLNFCFEGDEVPNQEWLFGLLGVYRPERGTVFRAAMAPFRVVDRSLFTTPEVSEGLSLRPGTSVATFSYSLQFAQ